MHAYMHTCRACTWSHMRTCTRARTCSTHVAHMQHTCSTHAHAYLGAAVEQRSEGDDGTAVEPMHVQRPQPWASLREHLRMCICMCLHACACLRMCACVHVCMCACVHVCMPACLHVCMRACLCMPVHVCMPACVHACMCACVHGHLTSRAAAPSSASHPPHPRCSIVIDESWSISRSMGAVTSANPPMPSIESRAPEG